MRVAKPRGLVVRRETQREYRFQTIAPDPSGLRRAGQQVRSLMPTSIERVRVLDNRFFLDEIQCRSRIAAATKSRQ